MENKDRWTITEEEKEQLINILTDELSALRAKAGISQEEISKLIGISRQTYGAIERKTRKMSWNTYLSLILFFDYTKTTHKMIRNLQAFPAKLVKCLNKTDIDNSANLYLEEFTNEINDKLDERALHAIKTVLMLEYARCSNLSNDALIKSFDSELFTNNDTKKNLINMIIEGKREND